MESLFFNVWWYFDSDCGSWYSLIPALLLALTPLVLQWVGCAIILMGLERLTRPEPHIAVTQAIKWRRRVRWAAGALAAMWGTLLLLMAFSSAVGEVIILAPVPWIAWMFDGGLPILLAYVAVFLSLAWLLVTLPLYMAGLAERVPDTALARRTRSTVWVTVALPIILPVVLIAIGFVGEASRMNGWDIMGFLGVTFLIWCAIALAWAITLLVLLGIHARRLGEAAVAAREANI